MIRFFLENKIYALFVMPVFVLGYLFLNLNSEYFEFTDNINLGFWGSLSLSNFAGDFLPWISGVLVLINAYILNYFFNTNGFYERNSYIISLLYIILLSYYRSFYFLDGLLISHFFIFFAFIQLYKMEYNIDGKSRAFNAGFFFGISATFHPPLALVIPFLWLMITRIRPFVFREILLSSIGVCVPLVYAFSSNLIFKHKINLNFIESTIDYPIKEFIFLVSIGLFVLLVLSSWVGIRNKVLKSSIRFRKNTNILNLFLLFSICIGSLDWIFFEQYEWFCFMVIPIALFLPFSYLNMRFKFFPHILFYLTLGFSVIKFFI